MHARSTREKKARQERNEEHWLAFKQWWEPYTHDKVTGSEVGGHPHAARLCVSIFGKRKHFGIDAATAYNCQCYRDEFKKWLKDGQPQRAVEVTGNPADPTAQRKHLNKLARILGNQPF